MTAVIYYAKQVGARGACASYAAATVARQQRALALPVSKPNSRRGFRAAYECLFATYVERCMNAEPCDAAVLSIIPISLHRLPFSGGISNQFSIIINPGYIIMSLPQMWGR